MSKDLDRTPEQALAEMSADWRNIPLLGWAAHEMDKIRRNPENYNLSFNHARLTDLSEMTRVQLFYSAAEQPVALSGLGSEPSYNPYFVVEFGFGSGKNVHHVSSSLLSMMLVPTGYDVRTAIQDTRVANRSRRFAVNLHKDLSVSSGGVLRYSDPQTGQVDVSSVETLDGLNRLLKTITSATFATPASIIGFKPGERGVAGYITPRPRRRRMR